MYRVPKEEQKGYLLSSSHFSQFLYSPLNQTCLSLHTLQTRNAFGKPILEWFLQSGGVHSLPSSHQSKNIPSEPQGMPLCTLCTLARAQEKQSRLLTCEAQPFILHGGTFLLKLFLMSFMENILRIWKLFIMCKGFFPSPYQVLLIVLSFKQNPLTIKMEYHAPVFALSAYVAHKNMALERFIRN